MIKVLFQTRYNIFERKGGDTVQLLKTKEALEKKYDKKIQIDIINKPDVDLSEYDIVHIFNLLRPQESYLYIKNALKYKKPIALSTIYWKSVDFEKKGQLGIRRFINKIIRYDDIERLRLIYRFLFDNEKHSGTKDVIKKGFMQTQKFILENSDILLPNGFGEITLLEKEFKIKLDNYVVVPNAIETESPDNKKENSFRKSVICVGRIEPRKNQLSLVKALSGEKFEVFIIGKVNDTQKKYYELVKKHSGPNIHFIEETNMEELKKIYKQAKVHVLPSWYDTPGLVSLEAGYYGCNLVVGKDGTTQEYFKDFVSYVDPQDVSGIKKAVLAEYEKDTDSALSHFIEDNYNWEITATKTFEGYLKILK